MRIGTQKDWRSSVAIGADVDGMQASFVAADRKEGRKEGRVGFVPKSRTRTEHQTSNVSIAVDYGKLIVLLVFCYCDQDYLVVLSLCVPHVSAIREYRNNVLRSSCDLRKTVNRVTHVRTSRHVCA